MPVQIHVMTNKIIMVLKLLLAVLNCGHIIHIRNISTRVRFITRPSLGGCIKRCTYPVSPSVRPSRASDFLETGKS